VHLALVRGYGQEPGSRLGTGTEGRPLPPGFHSRLLDGVLSVLAVSQHAVGEAKGDRQQGLDGVGEGGFVVKGKKGRTGVGLDQGRPAVAA
jgi:hypothetical protein